MAVIMTSMLTIGTTSPIYAATTKSSQPFDDISSSFARQNIIDLAKEGIIDGTGDRKFEPKKNVTRAEFITMTSRLLKLQPVDSDIVTFSDVPRSAWYYGWVQAGIHLGIVEGKGMNQFQPDTRITRQEAAVLIVRALKEERDSSANVELPYQDRMKVADWAVSSVQVALKLGLMRGDQGSFRPNDYVTREETAAILDRVFKDSYWSKVLNTTPASNIQLGWQNASTTAQYIATIKQSTINTLVPRWFFFDNNNDKPLANYVDSSLLTYAKQNNKKIWAMLGNRSNAEWTHTALTDLVRRDNIIKQLTAYVKSYGLAGINVDFENVSPQDRLPLTSFVTELTKSLHTVGGVVSIDVSPDLGTDWTDAFDYAALGKAADYVVLMGYDEHWDGDPIAGSVSSLPWVERATNKLLTSVSASKTILALPLYTRDWTIRTSGATSEELSLVKQGQRLRSVWSSKSWDSNLAQYVATYTQNGLQHRIWMEEGRSISSKYLMAAEHGIAGFAYWYIGAETADIWTSIRNVNRYSSY